MPPEQIKDAKSVGKTADVFALGATLYALLAGHAPFEGGTPMERQINTLLGRRQALSRGAAGGHGGNRGFCGALPAKGACGSLHGRRGSRNRVGNMPGKGAAWPADWE